MYLEFSPKVILGSGDIATLAANVGHTLINEVTVEIGGQQIDKHYGHWLETWAELTEPNPTGEVGSVDTSGVRRGTLYQRMSGNTRGLADGSGEIQEKMFIPLQFWFCRNPGLALPLIALQYHEVKINIDLRPIDECLWATNDIAGSSGSSGKASSAYSQSLVAASLYVDYIFLDTDERRRFAQVSHEYLIEQVQHSSVSDNTSFDLNFNHPVKELVWTDTYASGDWSGNEVVTGDKWKLVLNGHDRFAEREYRYFTRAQVWQHHTGFGGIVPGTAGAGDTIAVYSFALKPEEHQPSGTCNFSRIDNATLKVTLSEDAPLWVFAVNYNVLRIMSGMGGLAYSN